MKRALLAGLAAAWQVSAHAADALPAHVTGAWGTAESLYAGTVAQYELLLLTDGFGTFTGSTPPPTRTSGPDQGKPVDNARVVMGLPLRATIDGDVLTAQPFIPRSVRRPDDKAPAPEQMTITCRYQAAGPTLHCTGPDRREIVMKRYLETVPAETVDVLRQIQVQAAGDAG